MNLPDLDDLKAKPDTLRPLRAAAMRNLHDELALRRTYNTNAIEGNTLTRMKTKFELKGIAFGGKLRIACARILHRAATCLALPQPLDSAR